MLLEGLFLPLTTPYLPDGRLNLPKLRENVIRYAKTPAAGLVALSQSGQPSFLSDVETEEVLQCIVEAASPEKVLIAGVARDSVLSTLHLISSSAQMGYDAALIPVPPILRGTGNCGAISTFYEAVADNADLPIIIDSASVQDPLPIEVIARLARHQNIIAIVEAGRDIARWKKLSDGAFGIRREVTVTTIFQAVTGRMLAKHRLSGEAVLSLDGLTKGNASVAAASVSSLKTRKKTVGFQVLCGRTEAILDALEAGASGAMPALAASAPQACYEVLAAWKDGDPALAAEKQERVRPAAQLIEEDLGIAGVKYGCDLNGYFGGRPRLPSLPLSGEQRRQVESALAGLRS